MLRRTLFGTLSQAADLNFGFSDVTTDISRTWHSLRSCCRLSVADMVLWIIIDRSNDPNEH